MATTSNDAIDRAFEFLDNPSGAVATISAAPGEAFVIFQTSDDAFVVEYIMSNESTVGQSGPFQSIIEAVAANVRPAS